MTSNNLNKTDIKQTIRKNKDAQNTRPSVRCMRVPNGPQKNPPRGNDSSQVWSSFGRDGCDNYTGTPNSLSEKSSKNKTPSRGNNSSQMSVRSNTGTANSSSENSSKTNHTEPKCRIRSSSVDQRAPMKNITATSRYTDSYGSKQMTGSSSYPSSNTTEVSRNQNDRVSSGSGRQSRSDTRGGSSGRRSASLGLRNLGNTCYMNSVLQCLARVDWRQNVPKSSDIFVEEFLTLMHDMKAKDRLNVAISPRAFRRQIDSLSQRFRTSEQNDAHEFLLSLLGRLKKGMQRNDRLKDTNAATNSIIDELFDGEMENTVTFDVCGHPGITSSQPFFTLCLPIPASSNYQRWKSSASEPETCLEECIKSLIKKETMDGDNKLYCIECMPPMLQTGSLNLVLKKLPAVLILYLKRFDLIRKKKLETAVRFPVDRLDMEESGTGHVTKTCYRLVAVLNHIGSIDFGHYTADVLADRNWYHYSDSSVIEVSDQFCKPHVSSREAYILIYEKRD